MIDCKPAEKLSDFDEDEVQRIVEESWQKENSL
jgi:hypothetical protein